jgi:hypothetical protein
MVVQHAIGMTVDGKAGVGNHFFVVGCVHVDMAYGATHVKDPLLNIA